MIRLRLHCVISCKQPNALIQCNVVRQVSQLVEALKVLYTHHLDGIPQPYMVMAVRIL